MKVILLQDIAKLGKKFDVVNVSDGYGTNYLIPQKKAEQATPAREEEIGRQRAQTEAEREAYMEKVYEDLSNIKDKTVEIEAKINEKGNLFASLEKSDFLSTLKEKEGIELDEDLMVLEAPIKKSGEHTITFKIGEREVDITFSIVNSK